MAPSPQHDSEPKAPDKSGGAAAQPSAETRNLSASTSPAVQLAETKHVDGLDDGQLRALLDEAITYKCPKDREGKSLLFKELLEEVEQDEEAADGRARRGGGGGARADRGRRRRGERGLPHASSLQDLVQALQDVPPQRRRLAPVSARTHHGGSLPSGVDRSFLLGEEPVRSGGGGGGGADYIATVRCVNPPPLTERRVSVSDAHNSGTEMEILNRSKIPCSSVTYTSRATLDISSGAGRAHTTTTCSNQVDSGITFGCITTPAVVTSCNTTSSAPAPCPSVDSKPRSVITTSINGLASITRNYGAAGSSSADDFKKSLDENGNALQTIASSHSGSSQHKKSRKKKSSSKNETVAMSDQIDGYQGNKDLSELLRFIESDAEHGRSHKHKHHHDDDKATKKRSTERRAKDKPDKIQRANSMEELSLTKLEDLTHDKGRDLAGRKKKERVSDGGDARHAERRSWGDDARPPFYPEAERAAPPAPPAAPPASAASAARDRKNKSKQNKSAEWPPPHDAPPDTPLETLEFKTVTKKKRTRKRHSPHEPARAAADLYRKMRAPASPDRRRKSAPPSDKSNDSNDDLDSVHSLPAESTAERCAARPGSASSGGTPQASYADIARTRHNIPDLIESCNYYGDLEPEREPEPPPRAKRPVARSDSAPGDADGYPALEVRAHRTLPRTKQDTRPPPARRAQTRSETAADEPPDVVLDRRPAVILLDEEWRPREMDGITFGFDINEQLLNGEHPPPAPPPPPPPLPLASADEFPAINEKRRARGEAGVAVRAGGAALRYLPPAVLDSAHDTHLHKLANFVNSAWEEIVKCPGKVRYFSQ